MELRPELQIRTMIRAMTDVVLPAIDRDNKLAHEQGHLVVAMLRFLAQRLPLEFRYDRDELGSYVRLAEDVAPRAEGGERTASAGRELGECAAAAKRLLERAAADGRELETTVREIRAKVGAFVQAVYEDGETSCRAAVWRRVLDTAKQDSLRERSWVLPQGWELDPSAVPSIESLLR